MSTLGAVVDERRGAARGLLRVWLVLAGLQFLNELGTNLHGVYSKFHRAKVLNSISDDARDAVSALAVEVAVMLTLAVVLTLLVTLPWAAVCVVLRRRLAPVLDAVRVRRLLFWTVAGFAWFHAWYTVHDLLLPSSRACDSPLVLFGGAFDDTDLPWTSPRLLLAPVTVLGVLAATTWACATDRRLRRALVGGVAAVAVLVHGWDLATAPDLERRFSTPGSVVVLGLDSFQANRLALGGGRPDLAPNVDAFLRDSHRFDNAWTPFARTYPSWVSMFSGRYPTRNGVRFNLVPDRRLAPDNRYLGDVLSEHGYATLHATDETRFSIIRPLFGFDEQLHPVMGLPDFLVGSFFDFSAVNLARQTALGHDAFPLLANNRAVVGYSPALWVRSFLRELEALPADRPVFVTAHLCGNHWPFSSPFPYWAEHESGVDACIAMVDDQVGRILEAFDASGLSDSATVVMLSDHGDGWSGDPEDTTNTHGDHLDRLLANKVLLGVRRPGGDSGVTTELVRTFDLYPTVLDLAGVGWDASAIDGRSLLPLMAGEDEPPRSCFAESGFDKKTFLVSRLIEQSASWYEFDPESHLITLRDDGYDELMQTKSYMLMQDDVRLVLTPARGRFSITRFDRETGEETDIEDEVPEPVRLAMLVALLDHFGLDRTDLLSMARRRGFVGGPG